VEESRGDSDAPPVGVPPSTPSLALGDKVNTWEAVVLAEAARESVPSPLRLGLEEADRESSAEGEREALGVGEGDMSGEAELLIEGLTAGERVSTGEEEGTTEALCESKNPVKLTVGEGVGEKLVEGQALTVPQLLCGAL